MEKDNISNDERETSNQVEEKEKFKCEKCGKEFSHRSTCSQHKLTCGNGKSFDCKGCNKTFDRNDSLARPSEAGVQAGKSGGTFCQTSKKSFQTKWHLHHHKISCEKRCPKCMKKVSGNLADHVCRAVGPN